METERVELLLKFIAQELYWATRDRVLADAPDNDVLSTEDKLFRESALDNIDLLRREAGL